MIMQAAAPIFLGSQVTSEISLRGNRDHALRSNLRNPPTRWRGAIIYLPRAASSAIRAPPGTNLLAIPTTAE